MRGLGGRVVVITGAARGIGLGLAQAFAERGAHLVLCDIDEVGLEGAVEALHADGAQAVAVAADVTDPAALARVRDVAFDRFETVHVLCNNPGPKISKPLLDQPVDVDDWRSGMELLLYSVLHGLNAFLPRMLEQDEGHIVNTASLAGLTPSTLLGVYTPAKAAVVAVSELLAAELAEQGANIGVTVLTPALVRTPGVLASMTAAPDQQDELWMRRFLEKQTVYLRTAVDPIDLGRLTVRAVETGAFYVHTKRGAVDSFQQKADRMRADADRVGLS